MRRAVSLFILLYTNHLLFAQLYDKTWVCGTYIGTVTFSASQIDTASYYPFRNCRNNLGCVSNNNGDFMFFSEGVNVYSYDGSLMTNGTELADNSVSNSFYYGLPDAQNVIVLPKRNNQYWIIHQSQSDLAFASQPWYFTDRLYYSVVDMSLQGGKGEVTEKRTLVKAGSFMDGHMTACQHANGRDWWLVQRRYNFNIYYIYLVTPDSISLVREQQIGAISQEPDAVGQSEFSPDGTKYATITSISPLIVLDFDRCEGTFSNPQSINIPIDTFMFYGIQNIIGGGGYGLCFSPDSRSIYVNSFYKLRQYDLFAGNVDSSEQLIFFWTDSNETHGQFDQMHLAPNGKIYIANYQGFTKALHVINSPDSLGLACSFVKWGLPIATINAIVIPNMPHFRMGALAGSGCDTITGLTESANGNLNSPIRVYPNPASDIVEIDVMSYSQYHPLQQFYLYDVQGRLVKQLALPYLSAQLKVNDLPAGSYHWKVAVKEETRAAGRLEVIR